MDLRANAVSLQDTCTLVPTALARGRSGLTADACPTVLTATLATLQCCHCCQTLEEQLSDAYRRLFLFLRLVAFLLAWFDWLYLLLVYP